MRVPLLAFVLVVALAASAGADHCAGYSTSQPEVDSTATPAGRHYVDHTFCQMENCGPGGAFWVYEESNGLPGLQRGDEFHDDTCHATIQQDTLIF